MHSSPLAAARSRVLDGRAIARALPAVALVVAAASAPAQRSVESGLYSLPRSQDDIAEWQLASREIADRRYEAAVERLHGLLQRDTRGVVEVGIDRYLGLRKAVIGSLRDLPPAGREAYERLVARELGDAQRLAVGGLDEAELRRIATGFPTSDAGLTARIRLGDLALEAGRFVAAQNHYRGAIDAVPRDGPLVPALLGRRSAADALVRFGNGQPAVGDGGLDGSLRDVVLGSEVGSWTSYGGGYDGTRQMTPPVGQPQTTVALPVRADGFADKDGLLSLHAVGDLGGVFVNDGQRVHAFRPLERDPGRAVAWVAEGPMVGADDFFEDVRDSINGDNVLSCSLSPELVVAALHVPHAVVGAEHNQQFQSISVITKIASRRLFAFDRATGKRVWAHWDDRGGPISTRFEGHDACGPPLVHGDTVYVPTHDQTGAIAFYLAAYDLHSGEPRWRRLICSSQQEVNMFGNTQQEFAAAPLSIHGGVIYGVTNLGVCFAADADDGDVRWISGYDVIPLPRTQLHHQEIRPVFFANNPVVIHRGVMACTPLDSAYALGFDVESGQLLWRLPFDDERGELGIRWLLGAADGEFVFSGLSVVAAEARPRSHDASPRLIVSHQRLGADGYGARSLPRGAIAGDRVFFVGRGGQIQSFTLRGDLDPDRPAGLRLRRPGNLLLIDGLIVALRDGALEVTVDAARLGREAERALKDDDGDPAAWWRLAVLLEAGTSGSVDGAVGDRLAELLDRGLRAARSRGLGPHAPLYRRLADAAFQLGLRRAETIARRDPRRAVEVLRATRERAPTDDQWLLAQEDVLALVAGDATALVEELETMVERLGDRVLRFRDVGRVPVAAYALWRSLDRVSDPHEAVRRGQELMERFPDVQLGGRDGRAIGADALTALIAAHGPAVYAEIEERAARALELAGADGDRLRGLAERFPHSAAAATARARLLDVAVGRGDLAGALAGLVGTGRSERLTAGVLRRMAAAAAAGGNPALARAFAERLLSTHRSEVSDYGPDGGRSYGEVVELPVVPAGGRPTPELPAQPLARLTLPRGSNSTAIVVDVDFAPGFDPARAPLFMRIDGTRLLAFALDPMPGSLRDRAFELEIDADAQPTLVGCGERVVVGDLHSLRGVAAGDGAEVWTFDAEPRRALEVLGVRNGVLLVFSSLFRTNGDGGHLLGIEPMTGSLLYRHEFPATRSSLTPSLTGGAVLAFDDRDGDGAPAFEWLDPVTGQASRRVPLTAAALDSLDLAGAGGYPTLRSQDLQSRAFGDGETTYLALNARDDSPPRIVALADDGSIRWRWSGMRARNILSAGLRDGRVVVFESGRGDGSRLVVLDRGGRVAWARDVGGQARVVNWLGREVPDPVLIADRDLNGQGVTRLHCYSLGGDGPRFVRELRDADHVIPLPLLGPDFLVVATRRRGIDEPRIAVTRLDSRGRGALPDGADELELDLMSPIRLSSHGGHVIVDTFGGVTVLGTGK